MQYTIPTLCIAAAILSACAAAPSAASNAPASTAASIQAAETTASATLTAPTASTATPQAMATLVEALQIAPVQAQRVMFTDWTLAKDYGNARTISNSNSLARQLEFYKQANDTYQIFSSGFSMFGFLEKRDWGIYPLDFEWDSTILMPSRQENSISPLQAHVFKFKPETSIAAIAQHLDNYGYQHTTIGQTNIYTTTKEQFEVFADLNDPAFLSFALSDKYHMVIMSETYDTLRSIVDLLERPEQSLYHQPGIKKLANQLGSIQAIYIYPGESACTLYNLPSFRQQKDQQYVRYIKKTFGESLDQLHPYQTIALGFRREDERPTDVITIVYGDTQSAEADYETRAKMATDKYILTRTHDDNKNHFQLASSSVHNGVIKLSIQHSQNRASKLNTLRTFYPFYALCP